MSMGGMRDGMDWKNPGQDPNAALLRWAETGVAVLIATALLSYGAHKGLQGAWLGWGVAALGLPALGWAVVAWGRGRLKVQGDGPGVLEVDEGRIVYFAPEDEEQLWGGVCRIEELWTVEAVMLKRDRGLAWRLRPVDGAPLVIAVGAEGADALPEALSALPGFSMVRAARAFEHSGIGVRPIWRRTVHASSRIT